ncbi:MAG: hypothetical protein H6Q89_2842 [Myxococcaceae bacterium]|nr:hypothetical protein [Myxococcaceae bacterium]
MLLTFSIALLVTAAPQGRVVLVSPLEAQGATALQLATVRDAVLLELKAQGYDARAEELGAPKDTSGTVGGAVVMVKGTFEVMLRLKELHSSAIIATSTVRCGTAEKLAEAAKEAASQLAREGRQQWGMRTKFKPAK